MLSIRFLIDVFFVRANIDVGAVTYLSIRLIRLICLFLPLAEFISSLLDWSASELLTELSNDENRELYFGVCGFNDFGSVE